MSSISEMLNNKNNTLQEDVDMYCDASSDDNIRNGCLSRILIKVNQNNQYASLIKNNLGNYVTHHQEKVRVLAVQMLAEILRRLPDIQFEAVAIDTLLNFFLSRCATDYESTGPCLDALLVILDRQESRILVESQPDGKHNNAVVHVTAIVHAICKTYDVSAMMQNLRFKIFEIILLLLERPKYLDQMKKPQNAATVLNYFVDAMDGEKDPRCLLLCLKAAEIILTTFPEDVIEQECTNIFEVTSVYFPITFRPPPNDPFGITTEDLIDSLDNVFSGSPYMAKYVIPLVLEKLRLTSSEVVQAKIDSLRTLSKCVPKYGTKYLAPFLDSLSESLLLQMYTGDDATVEKETLNAIRLISYEIAITSSVQLNGNGEENMEQNIGSAWHIFVNHLLKESQGNITNMVDSMVGRASARILAALATGSALGLRCVIRTSLPMVTQWCKNAASTQVQRSAAISLLHKIVLAIDTDVDFPMECHPVKPFIEDMLNLLDNELNREIVLSDPANPPPSAESDSTTVRPRSESKVLNESLELNESKKIALNCYAEVIIRPPSPLVSSDRVATFVQLVTNFLVQESTKTEFSQTCFDVLIKIGQRSDEGSTIVLDNVLPGVIHSLDGAKSSAQFEYALYALSQLCNVRAVFHKTIPLLLNKIILKDDGTGVTLRESESITDQVFTAISSIVSNNKHNTEGLDKCCMNVEGDVNLVPCLLNLLESDAVQSTSLYTTHATAIFQTLAQHVSDNQGKILLETSVQRLQQAYDRNGATELNMALLHLLPSVSAVVSSVPRTFEIPNLENLMNLFLDVSTSLSLGKIPQMEHEVILSYCCYAIGSLFNKFGDKSKLDGLVDLACNNSSTPYGVLRVIADEEQSVRTRVDAMKVFVWIVKALATRGDKTATKEMGLKLVQYIASPCNELAKEAAMGFGTVVKPYSNVLNKECNAKEHFLFRQRFYTSTFNPLVESLGSTSEDKRDIYLLAIAALVEPMPHAVILDNKDTILPMIIRALGSKQVDINVYALHSFAILLKETPDSVLVHLGTVIPLLLEMTKFRPGLRAVDRAEALDCLKDISTLKYHHIHPFRHKVAKELRIALDDPKRGVRKQAVACRNAWLTISV